MAAIACQMPVDTVIGEARAQAAQPAEARPRARDIGVAPGVLRPAALNAITDVDGVRVGHVTLVGARASAPESPAYRKWSDLNLTRTLAAALVIMALAGIINALHGLGVF